MGNVSLAGFGCVFGRITTVLNGSCLQSGKSTVYPQLLSRLSLAIVCIFKGARFFSTVPGLTSAAMKGGQAMYGANFYANKHASWFGIDEDLPSTATYDLSAEVVHSLLHDQPLQAATQLEKQLMDDQTNLFALRIAHDLHKRNGATGHLIGSIPRVLPFWDGNLSGYRSLLGLHSASLVEGAVWGPAEEAGMRALSEVAMSRPGEGPSHDVVAVNALCDLFYLCGRSREGLRFLREISIERGPERSDQHLDPAIAVARAIFYMDVGSKDLALHQLDMALGVVPELDLDGLTRLTSAMWRAHCSYFIHDNNDPEERKEQEKREEREEREEQEERGEQALHRPMWSRMWTQWRKHGKSMDVNEGGEEWSTNRRQSGLQFGPVHAALATLVYGRLTPGAMDYGNGSEGDDAEDVEEEHIDHDLFDLWLLGDKGEMGKEQRQHTRQVYTGLLASSRGGQDEKAFGILSQYEYTWTNTVGGESIHHDALNVSLPLHCLNTNNHVQARAMLSERSFMRPGSPMLWDEYSKALAMAGESMAAQMADDHASNLGFGQGGFGAH